MHKMQLWFILQLNQRGLKLKFIQQQDGVSEALTIQDYFHDLFSHWWSQQGSDIAGHLRAWTKQNISDFGT